SAARCGVVDERNLHGDPAVAEYQNRSVTGWRAVCNSDGMRILVSNDDGIYSPGIAALADVASEFGDVRVVAPDGEKSSTAAAIPASRRLSYRATSIKGHTAYRVNGTPADCVSLGAYHWER